MSVNTFCIWMLNEYASGTHVDVEEQIRLLTLMEDKFVLRFSCS